MDDVNIAFFSSKSSTKFGYCKIFFHHIEALQNAPSVAFEHFLFVKFYVNSLDLGVA